jgi:hypothetical protein
MEQDYTSLPYVISNIVAVFVVISAMIWPTAARVLLSGIFVAASGVNFLTALIVPSAYLHFGGLTTNDFYRSIIFGPFNKHVQLYVFMIAACQLLIGNFIAYKGNLMKVAMTGGIFFLLAISPLSYGAAFPSTLILSLAFVILMGKKVRFNIYDIVYQKKSYSNQ